MKLRALSALLVVAAAGITVTVASCDNNSTNPGMPGANSRGGKAPEVLASRVVSIGSSNTPVGGATLNVQEDGTIKVGNLAATGGDGILSTFDAPANTWNGTPQLGDWPEGGGGVLTVGANDPNGNLVASIEARQAEGDATTLELKPNFTSAPGQGVTTYRVEAYDGATLVAAVDRVALTTPTKIIDINVDPCCMKLYGLGWGVKTQLNQCVWTWIMNPCCRARITLPDGTVINANILKFIEQVSNGVYVYVNTQSIKTTTNVPITWASSSAVAVAVAPQPPN